MKIEVGPQPGPQKLFLGNRADIVIYGGAAGGGKTFALLLEGLRNRLNADFSAVYFRRTMPQVTNPGGLWDSAMKVYPLVGAVPRVGDHTFFFPSGAKAKFAHLQHDHTRFDWQGAQIPLICFDELTHFTYDQFWYLVSRNRSMCGVTPYVRAGCNPDADSWVAQFIAWWIDQDTGLPFPERAGVIRYCVRVGDKLLWADTPGELAQYLPGKDDLPEGVEPPLPKSVSFIPASVYDNRELLRVDPNYLANLLAQPIVERERLLGGNWKIRPAAGLYFQRGWCQLVDAVPADLECVRYWDLAATEKQEGNDPDWTVGVKLGRDRATGRMYVLDVQRARIGPYDVEQLIKNIASIDGKDCRIGWGTDPGQAGKSQTAAYARLLVGYWVLPERETGDKVTRFGPTSAQCRAGNVAMLRGLWNDDFWRSLEGFPELAHDDDADAFSGAFDLLWSQGPGMNMFELTRRQVEASKRQAEAVAEREREEKAEAEIPFAKGSIEYEREAEARQRAKDEAALVSQNAPSNEGEKSDTPAPAPAAEAAKQPASETANPAASAALPASNSVPDSPPATAPVGSVEWMMRINSRGLKG